MSTSAIPFDVAATSIASPNGDSILGRIAAGLASKGFTFLDTDPDGASIRNGLDASDRRKCSLANMGFRLGMCGADLSALARIVSGQVIGFGADAVADEELAALRGLMADAFPVSAIAFSQIYGPRFAAIVEATELNGDSMGATLEQFERVNTILMPLGGRLSLKLFGRTVMGMNHSSATGSLFVVARTASEATDIRQRLAGHPLRNDTAWNQLKQSACRWQFWAKAAFGMVEYLPNQLRQEVLVVDVETGNVTSTATGRCPFEFGFSLSAVSVA
ncbi:MAG: hypothetical protein U0941_06335 [Planctomycetaceae bacterium]